MSPADIVDDFEEDFIPDDGARPSVDPDAASYKFLPNDKVRLQEGPGLPSQGPFWVGKCQDGKYLLCDYSGTTVKGGRLFEESQLTAEE